MRLTVSQKVNIGGAISAVVIVLIVAGALAGRTTLVDSLERSRFRSKITDSLNQLHFITQALINQETDYIVTQDIADYNRWSDSLRRLLEAIDTVSDLLEAPQQAVVLEDFVLAQFEYKKSFLELHQAIMRAAGEGRKVDIDMLKELHGTALQRTRVAAGIMIEAVSEMVFANQQMVEQSAQEAIVAVDRIELIVISLAVLGVLTTILMLYIAARTISRPLAMLTSISRKLAKGNFDLRIDIQSEDEIGKLAASFQLMADDLRSLYRSLEQKVSERTAELARSNAELEQFAYVASHDLQEPLRTISGFAELLARRYRGKIDAKADGYIRFVTEGALRMQNLVQALLVYSRLGAKDRSFQDVDCGALIGEVLASLNSAIKAVEAEIIVAPPLPTVLAERTQMAQLFQNLIANSIKFRSSQPVRIHISAVQESGAWKFSLEDNGIGMEPRHLDRIFIIFQRLHAREEYEGTGLGLAICKKVVERHGGKIWVTSEPGRGTTFYWTLPVHGSTGN